MSSPRYAWWGYVKNMIRRYPSLCRQYADLHTTSITAGYSLAPGSSGPSRTTENAAVRELPSTSQREYEAVRRAIATTERRRDGQDRLRLVRWVFWDNRYTLNGAAMGIPVSYGTAKNWHNEFIRTVAKYYGLMDEG